MAKKKGGPTASFKNEVILWGVLAISIVLFISNFGIAGKAGNAVSGIFFGLFGFTAYLFPLLLFAGTAFIISNKNNTAAMVKAAAFAVFVIFLCMFMELVSGSSASDTPLAACFWSVDHKFGGGLAGGLLTWLIRSTLGTISAYVIDIAVMICLVLITERSFFKPLRAGSRKVYMSAKKETIRQHQEHVERRQRRMDNKVAGVSTDTSIKNTSKPKLSDAVNEIQPDMVAVPDFPIHIMGQPLAADAQASIKRAAAGMGLQPEILPYLPENHPIKQGTVSQTDLPEYLDNIIPITNKKIVLQPNPAIQGAQAVPQADAAQGAQAAAQPNATQKPDLPVQELEMEAAVQPNPDTRGLQETEAERVAAQRSAARPQVSAVNRAEDILTKTSGLFSEPLPGIEPGFGPEPAFTQVQAPDGLNRKGAADGPPEALDTAQIFDPENIFSQVLDEMAATKESPDDSSQVLEGLHASPAFLQELARAGATTVSRQTTTVKPQTETAGQTQPDRDPMEQMPQMEQGIYNDAAPAYSQGDPGMDTEPDSANQYPDGDLAAAFVQGQPDGDTRAGLALEQPDEDLADIDAALVFAEDFEGKGTAASTEDIANVSTAFAKDFADMDTAPVQDPANVDTAPALKKGLNTKQSQAEIASSVASVEMQLLQAPPVKQEYILPPPGLLKGGDLKITGDSKQHLQETALKLQQTLKNFGVNVTILNVSCGPSVTRYEIQPEMGVKVSKIVNLADDIKLNLAAADIRIEAPIPGKAAIGIEVPNKETVPVMFRNLIESEEFCGEKSPCAFAVGKDIAGQAVVTDICKMPHLLIAGATGSGKSVCINTIIMSILYKADPEDVKLIMIDPKVVELSVYNGIPHLLLPVVTDPKKAAGALHWAVSEMMDRYQKFTDFGVRSIKGYNAKVKKLEPVQDGAKPQKMPYIVIIVDELADLMMAASSDVEDAICRLAQLARAAGLHLIIATQRPSVNVITGLIKANMPSRIAFSVTSGIDSRTILDMNGAEKLLGKGDMLFYPQGYQKPVRVQGAFVSDSEVSDVVEFLTEQNGHSEYSRAIEEEVANAAASGGGDAGGASSGDERDVYFADAAKLFMDKEKASVSMLQRYFKIGFNRAARIMDQLEEAGVVGPEEGTKPRKILMGPEEFAQFEEEVL